MIPQSLIDKLWWLRNTPNRERFIRLFMHTNLTIDEAIALREFISRRVKAGPYGYLHRITAR